ncbi:CoA transferase [Mycolicibacterium anyangense]|uniref:CoA transferase n=1 Tax=Mycolicibacterium anyangense TaxID=1431246 RepID=A0A6N4WF25_9MYCO|nr:CoA transferase [Mycolicibacterium anyangense]
MHPFVGFGEAGRGEKGAGRDNESVNDSSTGWAASGLAWLTGFADGPPDHSRAAVATRAESLAARLSAAWRLRVDAGCLLTGRAALRGLHRAGRTSAGGATRLLPTADGWCALTLSRPDDIGAVPALVEADDVPTDPWTTVTEWARTHASDAVLERAVLLDLPVARLGETAPGPPRNTPLGPASSPRAAAGLLVADLTSMWAGPLCGQLMASAGATVVKVESPHRPDGTRAGDRLFYDWINQGKLSYAIDFDRDAARLKALLAAADVVIEGSRPGALARRGLSPHALAGPPGRVWVRITGHGADSPRVAFGDDAAVAGGLVGASGTGPVFCGDAIADPLTGLETAVAVSDSLSRGGGELIEVVMSQVAATYAALPAEPAGGCEAAPPQPPPPAPPAAGLGDDNARVDALVAQKGVAPC